LITGEDGVLDGTCLSGGEFQEGTIWSYNPSNKVFRKIVDLPPTRGAAKLGGITPDGALYGRVNGGLFLWGRNGGFRLLYDFTIPPPVTPPPTPEVPNPPSPPPN